MKQDLIIKLDKVSKVFSIPHEVRSTLAESVIGAITRGKVNYEKFYALRSISLDVKRGDFLGIVGPNGSGKSTLLKVISEILHPDTGTVEVYGKTVSFLELGIGFVHDLTAKENIYLYGSILGLTRKEVDSKLKEIISFSELEKFLDTPLKDFSSGMMARLAFSIAKGIEADLYIIDEVLSVGDDAFQEKCLKVFEELKNQGKTLIFVSHDKGLVAKICNKCIVLKKGKIVRRGNPKVMFAEKKKVEIPAKPPKIKIIPDKQLTAQIKSQQNELVMTRKDLEATKKEMELIKKHFSMELEKKKKAITQDMSVKLNIKDEMIVSSTAVIDKFHDEITQLRKELDEQKAINQKVLNGISIETLQNGKEDAPSNKSHLTALFRKYMNEKNAARGKETYEQIISEVKYLLLNTGMSDQQELLSQFISASILEKNKRADQAEQVKVARNACHIIREFIKRLESEAMLLYGKKDALNSLLAENMHWKEKSHESEILRKSISKLDSELTAIHNRVQQLNQAQTMLLDSNVKDSSEAAGKGFGSHTAEINAITFISPTGKPVTEFQTGEKFTARISYIAHKNVKNPQFGIAIHTEKGVHITGPNNVSSGMVISSISGAGYIEYVIDRLPLFGGKYFFTAALLDSDGELLDYHYKKYPFTVRNSKQRQEGTLDIASVWKHTPK